jgi:hypothetical protein
MRFATAEVFVYCRASIQALNGGDAGFWSCRAIVQLS